MGHIPAKLATELMARAESAPIWSWSLGRVGHTGTQTVCVCVCVTNTHTQAHTQTHIHTLETQTQIDTYAAYTYNLIDTLPVECLNLNATYQC